MKSASKPNGQAQGFDAQGAVSWERAALGCLIEDPNLWADADLTADDFLLSEHRKIWRAMCQLRGDGMPADIVTLANALDGKVESSYLSAVVEGCVTESFRHYVRQTREASRERSIRNLAELLVSVAPEKRPERLEELRKVIQREDGDQNWRGIFHTAEEFENAPPLRFAINGFLQEAGITLIGGLSGHGKTLLMLAMTKALLEARPLFGHEPFSVPHPATRVLYLIPESSLGPFWSRLQLFGLREYIHNDRLLVRTLSSRERVSLKDPRLLKAAEGAHVFLDTCVRFMEGSENDAEDARAFAEILFQLLHSGARLITGAHHSPKGFEGQDYMTLENVLRGSGDLGANLCCTWGVRQIDAARNQLYIQNVKPRDFCPCEPFILEGRPHLDTAGQFKMLAAPGEAGELREHLERHSKGGRPAREDKDQKLSQALALREQGKAVIEIAKILGIPNSTLDRWLFKYDSEQKQ
jgi:hypothetical protein